MRHQIGFESSGARLLKSFLLHLRNMGIADIPRERVFFTIGIDTEQDVDREYIHTGTYRNITEGIPKLLDIFDDFEAKPTWLITPDVAQHCGTLFLELRKDHEIGAHIHPEYSNGPIQGIRMGKIFPQFSYQHQLAMLRETLRVIEENVGVCPESFRAGRFAINTDTLRALDSCGLKVDCSLTPFVDWRFNTETLSPSVAYPYFISLESRDILEIPVTIVNPFGLFPAWLRPSLLSGADMINVMKIRAKSREDPLVFSMMFHSMELVDPNPYFPAKVFLGNMRSVLEYAHGHNVCFVTMSDLYRRLKCSSEKSS